MIDTDTQIDNAARQTPLGNVVSLRTRAPLGHPGHVTPEAANAPRSDAPRSDAPRSDALEENGAARPQAHTTDSISVLREYWTSLAGGAVPERLSIDPRRIQSILPSVFLLERIATEQACLRIAGQSICDLVAMDMRGLPLGCLFTTQGRGDMRWAIRQVFDGPAGVELSLRGQRLPMMWRPPVGRMVILPLSDRSGVNRAIGAIDLPEAAFKRQQIFDVTDMRSEAIAAPHPDARETQVDAAFAQADALRERIRSRPSGKPALRLVKSDHPVDLS